MTYAKEEMREYQREWMRQRRQEWIDSQGGCCVECSSTENLEVDHIDPSLKTIHATSIWSRRQEIREAELANCQVLCFDCHKEKTLDQFTNVKHSRSTVDQIISEYQTGNYTQKQLAKIYGVSTSQVQRYVRGEQRRHTF